MYDLLVIGAGPAGMTAAIYGRRGNLSVGLLEKMSYGGQIINTPEVENYPGTNKVSGFELADTMFKQATELGAELVFGEAKKVEKTGDVFKVTLKDGSTEGKVLEAKSVILATGLEQRKAGLEREDKLVGAGISYCATCDGAFFRGKDVAILGGGNTALEDAEYMSNIANKVYLIHRRDEFRGDSVAVDRLRGKDNVEMILSSVPVELIGDPVISGLKVKNVNTQEEKTIDVNAVFVAYGHIPVNGDFDDVAALDEVGFFASGEDCATKTPGLFVAGDCRAKTRRQLVTATADGAVAAMSAIEYIHNLG